MRKIKKRLSDWWHERDELLRIPGSDEWVSATLDLSTIIDFHRPKASRIVARFELGWRVAMLAFRPLDWEFGYASSNGWRYLNIGPFDIRFSRPEKPERIEESDEDREIAEAWQAALKGGINAD